ncbi:MAG TPA: restriction endonuclease [Myxococcota bacterium]|jgi:hypothetical protein|nr:restriction endonuclease [Myxococcota bacterium]
MMETRPAVAPAPTEDAPRGRAGPYIKIAAVLLLSVVGGYWVLTRFPEMGPVVLPLVVIVGSLALISLIKTSTPVENAPVAARDTLTGEIAAPVALPLARLRAMAPADFTKLAVHVLEELGFEIKGVAEAVSDGSEYFIAVNPEPIKGGKFVVECWARPIGSLVDSPRVLALIDSVKAEGAAKGLYLTPFEFSQEAQTAAATGPIDLLDGAALVKLVQKKLPDRLVER